MSQSLPQKIAEEARKQEITELLVHLVADLLVDQGVKPTLDRVRSKIRELRADGSGGSYTTLTPYLRRWKAKQAASVQVVVEEMPESLQDVLHRLGLSFWRAASENAGAKVKALQQEANERIKAAEDERDQLLEEITRLEADLAARDRTLNASAKELQTLKANHEVLQQEKSRLTGQNEELTTELTRFEKLLNKEQEAHQATGAKLDSCHAEYKKAQKEFAMGLEDLEEERDGALKEVERLTTELEKYKELDVKFAELTRTLENERIQSKAAGMEGERLLRELKEERDKYDKLREEVGNWKGKYEQLSTGKK